MIRKQAALLFCTLLFLCGAEAAGEKVVVIVNAGNTQALSLVNVKNIYSDNVISWSNGTRIAVYDLPVKSDVREVFSLQVLRMSAQNAATEWANRKITNSAKNPPMIKPESVVVSAVSKDPEAIGYVSASAAAGKDGIRVVMTLE